MIRRVKAGIVRRLGIDRVAAHTDRLDHDMAELTEIARRLDRELVTLRARLDEVTQRLAATSSSIEEIGPWAAIARSTAWAESAPPRDDVSVSVVMATRDRAELVERAVRSVQAQRHTNWELIVVDDGSTDATPAVLAELAKDSRLRVTRAAGVGAAAARNLGVAVAMGELVAFVDDDNLMAPGWLHAAVDHMARHLDCAALYGAQLREHEVATGSEAGAPWLLYVDPYDQARICRDNFIDLGALVVRRTHPELRFDESLDIFIDWEMIARIGSVTPPHPLAVISGTYATGAPRRITDHPDHARRLTAMRDRLARLVPDATDGSGARS